MPRVVPFRAGAPRLRAPAAAPRLTIPPAPGVEVLRASIKGDGPTGKAWVFWQDRGCTGYVKNPRFDDAGGDPGALMGRGALTVQHPKLSAHRLQAPFDGDVGAAWQAFYRAHFGVPSLVRTLTRPAGGGGEPFCGGVTFHVFEPPLGDAAARQRAQTEQWEDLRAAVDDMAASAGGLDRAALWDEDQVLALLRDACGLTRGDVEHSAAQPVHFYCPCSRNHVLEERLRHAKQLRRDVWQLMQQDSFKLACPSCGEQHRYTPTDVRAAAGKAKQARLQASLRATRDYQAAWAVEAARDDALAQELARGLELDAPLSFEDVLGGGGEDGGRRRGLPTRTATYSPR